MKKVLLVAAVLSCSMAAVQAQTMKEEVSKSQERAAKLQALCDNSPEECGNEKLDAFVKSVNEAAILSIENSKQLEKFYTRQIGETRDGVTGVSVEKPTIEEWVKLGTTVTKEGVAIKNAADNVKEVSAEVESISASAGKERNPMKAAKTAKLAKGAAAVLKFGNTAIPILLEESAAQAKAVQEIIKTLKSGGNL